MQVTVENSNECSDALVCVVIGSGKSNVIGYYYQFSPIHILVKIHVKTVSTSKKTTSNGEGQNIES